MLPAGKYIVSDPCYVMCTENHNDWINLLNRHDYFQDGGEFEENGMKFAVFGTKCGDGCYWDQEYREYFVDAGLLACIPIDLVDKESLSKGLGKYFHEVEMKTPFNVSYNDGEITFGNVVIDTDPSIDEEDDHDYDDYYEDDY